MTNKPHGFLVGLLMLSTALVGCSSASDDAAQAESGNPPAPSEQASTPASEDESADGAAAGDGDSGSATLVVGDETYTFDNYVCAFGYSSTQSDIYSFSSNSFGEVDGVRVQMQLDVQDPSGGDQLTGGGVTQEIHLDDIEDFENPSIRINTESLDATFDGDDITAKGTFWDEADDPNRQNAMPGTFEATCGAGTRR